ncbi:MAG: hypothetical protein RLW62_04580, partial [Gammaproteobacteria bacterium]
MDALAVQQQGVAQAVPQAVPQGGRDERLVAAYDPWLIGVALVLLAIGIVMVVSTSVAIAER